MNDNPYAAPQATDFIEKDTTEYDPQQEPQLASRWMRLWGSLLDIALLLVINIPLGMTLGYVDFESPSESFETMVLGNLISFAVFVLLNGYLIFTRGQTIGKLICGTVVVDKESYQPVNGVRYLALRELPLWILNVLPDAVSLIAVINYLLIFRSDKNCLHDDLAHTRVVTKKSLVLLDRESDQQH